ncbi:uncharacterized protein [Drosophila virilis]|uniref:Uncharacterized protein n=1 Tax=Drosophila virilis TaxID=7244 RepID=B4LDQ3_DROVI|nr:uncharacterized protein LOC6622177 [Drosophila virilis]EDW70014.2 uncharacterized protein Dvir_GJ13562 [Drosophila virilis]
MLPHKGWAHMSIAAIIRELEFGKASTGRCESMTWLMAQQSLPLWSRRLPRRSEELAGRLQNNSKWFQFDVEVHERLWSLWGGLHPRSTWFNGQARGHQTLACCVVACCAASVFRSLGEWTSKFLDAIVINGDKYYRKSLLNSRGNKKSIGVNDLALECDFQDIHFMVQLQLVAFGQLYSSPASNIMGLYEALNYFFTRSQWGILVCQHRYIAFGYSSSRDGGYFLYDCTEWDKPLFPDNMGASYVLRAKQLLMLLYIIVVTLNVRKPHVEFQLYSVEANRIMDQDIRLDEESRQ